MRLIRFQLMFVLFVFIISEWRIYSFDWCINYIKENQIYFVFHIRSKRIRKKRKKTLMNFYMWNYKLRRWTCVLCIEYNAFLFPFHFVTYFLSHIVYCDLYVLFCVPWLFVLRRVCICLCFTRCMRFPLFLHSLKHTH